MGPLLELSGYTYCSNWIVLYCSFVFTVLDMRSSESAHGSDLFRKFRRSANKSYIWKEDTFKVKNQTVRPEAVFRIQLFIYTGTSQRSIGVLVM